MGLFNFKKKSNDLANSSANSIKPQSNLQDNGFPKKSEEELTKNKEDKTNNNLVSQLSENNTPGINNTTISVKLDKNAFNNLLDKEDTTEDYNKDIDSTNKGKTKSSKPIMSYITVKRSNDEGLINVKIKHEDITSIINIPENEFKFNKDFHDDFTPYRVLGIDGSILVNSDELDFIITRFKNIK